MLSLNLIMRQPTTVTRRHRRHSSVRRLIRRRWADYVVITALIIACLVALFLLLDVIDTTISKPDRIIPGATTR
jgi:uncharacterized membrane protein